MATQVTSFTLTELIDRTRGDLGLRGNGLITETDVTNWSRDIMRQAAQAAPWYRKSDSVDATSGIAEYDLPSDAITLLSVAYRDIPLQQVSIQDLEYHDPYWRSTASGTPYLWYRRGFTGYTIYPTPSATLVNGIDRIYTAIPAMPATAASTFNFPQSNEQLIISYCLFRASLKDASGEGAPRVTLYQREYLTEMERLKESVSDLGGEATVMGIRGTGSFRAPFDISWRTVPAPGAE